MRLREQTREYRKERESLQVDILIKAGASIELPNDESYTPLMEAAREGHGVSVFRN